VAAASDRARNGAVRVIFLGPPGAGKGTQAARLAAHLGVPKISTGEMLRDAIARKTPLGREAGPLIDKGRLVPDHLLVALIGERTAQDDCKGGFLLDGFPRTLPQAKALEGMPGGDARGFVVFDFAVPREELMRRLSGRRLCPNCQATYHLSSNPPKQPMTCDVCGSKLVQRDDDMEAVVERRLQEYDERTLPLAAYYRERTRMVAIDGNRPPEAVFQALLSAVEVSA
jgi:adenylate kinase